MRLYSDNIAISVLYIPWALPNIRMEAPFPSTTFPTFCPSTSPGCIQPLWQHLRVCVPPLLTTVCATLPSSCALASTASTAPGLQPEAFQQSWGASYHTLEAKGIQESSAGSEPWRQCSSTAGFLRVRGGPITTFICLSSAQLQAPPHWKHTHSVSTHTHTSGAQKLALIGTLLQQDDQ